MINYNETFVERHIASEELAEQVVSIGGMQNNIFRFLSVQCNASHWTEYKIT